MSRYFNNNSILAGDVPLGSFNAMFNFGGSWQVDAASTKSLAMVGYFIPLYRIMLSRSDLVLHDEIKQVVPQSWNPASLASFIENYGTHVVTSATIGGRDVVYVRQHQSSPLATSDIENYVKEIGEQRFIESQPSAAPVKYKDKDVTIILRRGGGDDLEQTPKKWADCSTGTRCNIQRKEPVCPYLQFSLMGPKLYISPEQVTVGRKPVQRLFNMALTRHHEANSAEFASWCRVNAMLVAWILQSIEPTLRSTVSYSDQVQTLWEDLKQRFSIGNAPRIYQLRTEIARCQQFGQSVSSYFGRLKLLWDELQNYVIAPGCSCGFCKCSWTTQLQTHTDDNQVHQFLMGLDDEAYGTLRSMILAQDPMPGLNRIYSLVVQEERHRTMSSERSSRNEGATFAAQRRSTPSFKTPSTTTSRAVSNRRSDKPTCTHCSRVGHDASACFQLHGYPDWWEEYRQTRGESSSAGKGRGRGVGRGRGSAVANAAHTPSTGSSSQAHDSQDRDAFRPALSNRQWQQMMDLLNQFKNSPADKLMGPHFEDGDWRG